ncbi:MAG: response regulator [Rudaea sp.]
MQAQSRILVLEDDESVSSLICDVLGSDYDVEACDAPRQALKMLKQKPYDLLILDLGLPGIDGVQVIEQIRAEPSLARMGILVVSAYYDLRRRVPSGQVSAVLPKPFSVSELREQAAAILGHRQGAERSTPRYARSD